MEYLSIWDFDRELKRLVKTSIEKKNKENTVVKKVNTLLIKYDSVFKSSNDQITINHLRLKRLEMKEKAFVSIKSGYFKLEDFDLTIKLTEIKSYSSIKNLHNDESMCLLRYSDTDIKCSLKNQSILKEIFES